MISGRTVFFSALLLVCLVTTAAAQDVFVYVDGEGVIHFTDLPRSGWKRVRLGPGGTIIEPKTRGVMTIAFVADNAPYSSLINKAARDYGLDGELIAAVIDVESSGNPRAVSHANAKGLMQLIDETAGMYSVNNIFDPAQNIDAGSRHLRNLLDAYDGDLRLALAAYNAGQGAVARHGGVPPYAETRRYIEKIAERYSFNPAPISDFELAGSYVAARVMARGERYIYRYETRNGYVFSEVIPKGRVYRKIDLFK